MGRGRAKAKQVKVARQLKYGGGGTDLDRLRAELGVGTDQRDTDERDAYADYGDRYFPADDDDADEDDDDDDLDDAEV
ncbi:MAG: DUF3073 domain-containing protein [Actinomycetota bacterium]|jgi:hypothetical protein|nr:DUF3073 domain-containing protein [Actinomycetota bacterium]